MDLKKNYMLPSVPFCTFVFFSRVYASSFDPKAESGKGRSSAWQEKRKPAFDGLCGQMWTARTMVRQTAGRGVGKECRPRPLWGAAAVPQLDDRVSSVRDGVIEQRKI